MQWVRIEKNVKALLMKKLFHFVVVLLLASLIACGGGGGGDNETDPTPAPDMTPSPSPTPIMDQSLRLTSASPGVLVENARYTQFSVVDLNAQRLKSRVLVNVAAGGETIEAKAIGYSQFNARAARGALHASINWRGTLLSAVNLSASTEMIVALKVREINPNGSPGPEIFSRRLERDGIGSGLKAAEVLNVDDGIDQAYELNMKVGQRYRVEVELECKLRVDVISFALIDCNAETGNRGVFVNELEIMY
jgi:hypothetical protein